jgi:putative hydrolase of the HAD superfamily|tara:strand:+ start:53 stop:679 length:627 start_codon:yes stop_codon:yes gene_type:complete
MIRVLFFDIGGVLIDIHPERTFQYISDCTDLDIEIVKQSFPNELHNQYEKGLINNKEWFLGFKDALPQPVCLKESDFWHAWKLLLGKEKKTVQIIKNLSRNYSIWLLSNTNVKHIDDELKKRYIFPDLVDGAVYSFDVGLRKPDKSIYSIALEKAGVQPDQCVYIDDLIENVEAGREAGFISFHFKSFDQLRADLNSIGFKITGNTYS